MDEWYFENGEHVSDGGRRYTIVQQYVLKPNEPAWNDRELAARRHYVVDSAYEKNELAIQRMLAPQLDDACRRIVALLRADNNLSEEQLARSLSSEGFTDRAIEYVLLWRRQDPQALKPQIASR